MSDFIVYVQSGRDVMPLPALASKMFVYLARGGPPAPRRWRRTRKGWRRYLRSKAVRSWVAKGCAPEGGVMVALTGWGALIAAESAEE